MNASLTVKVEMRIDELVDKLRNEENLLLDKHDARDLVEMLTHIKEVHSWPSSIPNIG